MEGEGKGKRKEGEKRQRQKLPLQKMGRQDRESEHTDWKGGRRNACLGSRRQGLGVGGACLLKGQGTQVTDQASRLQHSQLCTLEL